MSRYIDAEPLIKDLTAMKSTYDAIALDGMIKALNEAPTVDVVKAPVRCKDCKHSEPIPFESLQRWCKCFEKDVRLDGCCSYGERRANE